MVAEVNLECASAQHVTDGKEKIVVYDAKLVGKRLHDVFEFHLDISSSCPFETHYLGYLGQPFNHIEREFSAGPVSVVNNDADVRRLARSQDMFVEIVLRVVKVKRAGHLNEGSAQSVCLLGQLF